MFKRQRIRDPIHNLVEFSDDEFEHVMWSVLQTRPFQRLRRVKQLGFSDLVFPGATHSRFAHSVGVFNTARLLMRVVREHLGSSKFRQSKAEAAIAAALVHDLGHGPFSHAFEEVGKRLKLPFAQHEDVSDELIRTGEVQEAFKALGSGFADDVAAILTDEKPTIYGAVVSSQFDADRLDYMRRDRMMTGTGLGAIDFEWLLGNLMVGEVAFGVDDKLVGKVETFVIGTKAIRAAEAYVLGLFQLYPAVYFHKTTRGAEKLFSELLFRLFKLVKDGSAGNSGLSAKHPLIKFGREPGSINNLLELDDTVVWGAMTQLATAKDPLINDFARRLRDRRFYKAIDVREVVVEKLGVENPESVDKVCAKIAAEIRAWPSKKDSGIPRVLQDEAVRVPYKEVQESGPVNQIMVKPSKGSDLVDIGKRSEVLFGLRPFKLFRVYVRDEDEKAREFVGSIIRRETENGRS